MPRLSSWNNNGLADDNNHLPGPSNVEPQHVNHNYNLRPRRGGRVRSIGKHVTVRAADVDRARRYHEIRRGYNLRSRYWRGNNQ